MTCLCFRMSEVSTRSLKAERWHDLRPLHSYICWLLMAVTWDLSWGFQLEHLHITFPCVLGCLLGSKGEFQESKSRAEDILCFMIQLHRSSSATSTTIQVLRQLKRSTQFQREVKQVLPLDRGVPVSYDKKTVWTMWNGVYIFIYVYIYVSLLQFNCPVMSDSL